MLLQNETAHGGSSPGSPGAGLKLRVVNYREMSGGGLRFFVQLTKALHDVGGLREIEFVSHGRALEEGKTAFADYGIGAKFVDIPARGGTPRPGFAGFKVRAEALEDCEVAWFPWSHSHRIPPGLGRPVVASYHDALMFTEPRLALNYPSAAADERETVRQWLESQATMVCTSRYTIEVLVELFRCPPTRMEVITLSGRHQRPTRHNAGPVGWHWLSSPYFLCPANISWHKNHEVLLEGYARSRLEWPLVLTGSGSDLVNPLAPLRRALRRIAVALGLRPPHRAGLLRKMADSLGLEMGRSLIPLGSLPESEYNAVLGNAACLVMPTLGEGGGSFPVEEALLRGIPVICSDIPVVREQVSRLGAEVTWFHPSHPGHLAERLREVVERYPVVRSRALAQVDHLRPRTWADVAKDYLRVFQSVAAMPR